MTNIKMIVTDLDRTLLRPDKTISAYMADVLHRCQERGIKVVFATAREYLPAFHVDFSNGLGCNAYKITVEITDEPTAYEIASLFPTVGVIPFSGEGWYRYADEKATKWCGIKALSEYSCVSIEEIAAFGDDFNDLEMLKNCGIGVAVANAIDEVKSVADFVCDINDNDGVAKWIEVNVL